MIGAAVDSLLQGLGQVDPGPLFVLSLAPYLAFLWWARRIEAFPGLARRGFELTLLFVAVTIGAAVVAERRYSRLLADVDSLHGAAEAFLTLANLLVALGFARALASGPQARQADQQVLSAEDLGKAGPEDGASAQDP